MAKLYLLRFYLVLLSLSAGFIFLLFQGSVMSIFNPFGSQSGFTNRALTTPRFVCVYLGLINVVILVTSVFSLYQWPEWTISRTIFDSLYLLRELKVYKIVCVNQLDYKSNVMQLLNSQFVTLHTNADTVVNQKNLIPMFKHHLKSVEVQYKQSGQNPPPSQKLSTSNDEVLRKNLLRMVFSEIDKVELDVEMEGSQKYDNEGQAL